MKKRITFLLLALSSVVWSQTPENSKPLNSSPGEVWEIKWNRSDNFGVDTDNTEQPVDYKKWQQNPQHVQTWTWDNDKNCVQKNGILSITARFDDAGADRRINQNCGGVTTDLFYTSGLLKSFAQGTYGYYEARIKGANLFPGVSPAFWMFSNIDDSITQDGKVRYSEVDVVEMTQRGDRVAGNEMIMDHNLHAIVATRFKVKSNGYDFDLDASGNKIPLSAAELSTNKGRRWFRPGNAALHDAQENVTGQVGDPNRFDPRADFHTYGCKITEEKITWYIDNRVVGEKLNDKWHRQMNVALSLGIRAPYTTFCNNAFSLPTRAFALANRGKFPQTMQVDYVRVWELKEGGATPDPDPVPAPGPTTDAMPRLWFSDAEIARIESGSFESGGEMDVEVNYEAGSTGGTNYNVSKEIVVNLIQKDASGGNTNVYTGTISGSTLGTKNGTANFKVNLKTGGVNAVATADLPSGGRYIITSFFRSSKDTAKDIFAAKNIVDVTVEKEGGATPDPDPVPAPDPTTDTMPRLWFSDAEIARIESGSFESGGEMDVEINYEAGSTGGTNYNVSKEIVVNFIQKDASGGNTNVYTGTISGSTLGTKNGIANFKVNLKTGGVNAVATADLPSGGRYIITSFFRSSKDTAKDIFVAKNIVDVTVEGTTLSVDEFDTLSNDSTVSIYPNPVTGDAFRIEFKKVTKDVVVEILDINGRSLMNMKDTNKETIELPVDGLNAGLYFVKINAKNSTSVTKKIVIE